MILIGNLGRDPEQRNLNDGSPVVNLSLAPLRTQDHIELLEFLERELSA